MPGSVDRISAQPLVSSVDRISTIKKKPEDYPLVGSLNSKNYLIDLGDEKQGGDVDSWGSYKELEKLPPNLPVIDTIASANSTEVNPSQTSAINTEQADLVQPKLFSFDTLIDIGKKIWSWISAPFTSQKEVQPVTKEGSSDNLQGISGTPSLQSPVLVNKETLEKMILDLIEQARIIEESTNDIKDQNLEDEKRFILRTLLQYQLRKEGIENTQFQFIFNQRLDHEIRKEQSDIKNQNIELEKNRVFWSHVNTGVTIAAVAVLVASVAIAAIGSGGLALAAIPPAVGASVKALGATLAIAGGGTTVIKGMLTSQQGELRGKTELLDYKHRSLNEALRNESSLTNAEYNKALENYAILKEMLDNMRRTSRILTSR